MKFDVVIKDATSSEITELVSFLNGATTKSLPSPAKTKKNREVVSKLKIPFSCGTKEYQRARRLCIAYGGVPYLDAMRESGMLQINEAPISNSKEPNWKEVIKNSVNPIHEPRVIE